MSFGKDYQHIDDEFVCFINQSSIRSPFGIANRHEDHDILELPKICETPFKMVKYQARMPYVCTSLTDLLLDVGKGWGSGYSPNSAGSQNLVGPRTYIYHAYTPTKTLIFSYSCWIFRWPLSLTAWRQYMYTTTPIVDTNVIRLRLSETEQISLMCRWA